MFMLSFGPLCMAETASVRNASQEADVVQANLAEAASPKGPKSFLSEGFPLKGSFKGDMDKAPCKKGYMRLCFGTILNFDVVKDFQWAPSTGSSLF